MNHRTIPTTPGNPFSLAGLILAHHFTTFSKFFVHVFDSHTMGLRGDVYYHLWLSAVVVEHGPFIEDRMSSLRRIGIEIVAET